MKLKGIRKIYHNKNSEVEALKGIDLTFETKGLSVILGPSGCGKTTLMNIISGDDQEFEGERIEVPVISYLTQEIQLFENMSVYENLITVLNDPKQIEEYLIKFDLWEHRNKKVKKCSNGQKKRVQFIRSLLFKPQLLLCDEPTAALDHENAELLMNYLKEVSQEIQVVLVTHDISISEKYADRVIQMGKGTVEKDEWKHVYEKADKETGEKRKDWKETLSLTLREYKSRIGEHFLLIILCVLSMLMIFTTKNLYTTVKSQSDTQTLYYKGKNIVESRPNSYVLQYGYWLEYDMQLYEEIRKVIETSDEILAVEAFYDHDIYDYAYGMITEEDPYDFGERKDAFKPVDLDYIRKIKEITENSEILWERNSINNDRPIDNAFLISNQIFEKMDDYVEDLRDDIFVSPWLKEVAEIEGYFGDDHYGINMFDLMDDSISLITGQMPLDQNEVIVSKNTADMIMEENGIESYDELIGQTIHLGVYGFHNYYSKYYQMLAQEYSIVENPVNMGEENMRMCEIIDLKVVGITDIENEHLRMMFFRNEFTHNPVMNHFVDQREHLYFHYVRFLLKPEANVDAFVEKVNTMIPGFKSTYQSKYEHQISYAKYQDPKTFMIYSTAISVLFLSLIMLVYLFIGKRYKKEHKLMKEYGYDVKLEQFYHTGLMALISFLTVTFLAQNFCRMVNQFAQKQFGYARFMKFDLNEMILSFFVVFIIIYLIEIVLWRIKHD